MPNHRHSKYAHLLSLSHTHTHTNTPIEAATKGGGGASGGRSQLLKPPPFFFRSLSYISMSVCVHRVTILIYLGVHPEVHFFFSVLYPGVCVCVCVCMH